jgi:hypothetical protein
MAHPLMLYLLSKLSFERFIMVGTHRTIYDHLAIKIMEIVSKTFTMMPEK